MKMGGYLKRYTPLRSCSPKHAKGMREYREKRLIFLAHNPQCQIQVQGCTNEATEIHHRCRRGPHLNDTGTWMSACRNCHDWVETHASQARAMGFILTLRKSLISSLPT